MPTFDLTYGDVVLIAITVALVALPSRISRIGDFIGRLCRRGRT
jgi:hypothetical protein